MPKDTVIIEIRPAEGGDDAKMFTFDLFKMISAHCKSKRWKVELVAMREASRHGYQEITFLVRGQGALADLLNEAGGHRVQRVPPTEKRGRRQTSTVTVAVLAQASNVDLKIRESDLKVETMRGTGPGGQHRNTTDSAVRVTHIPTGINAYSDTKSQHDNKRNALAVLKARLVDAEQRKATQSRNAKRKKQVGMRMRGDKIRTIRYQDGRVIDHRTRKKTTIKRWETGHLDDLR